MPRQKKPAYRPPILEADKALRLLKEKIASGTELLNAHYEDHRITEWENSVQNLLALAFGDPHDNLQAFHREGPSFSYLGMPDSEYQQRWISGQKARLAILKSAVEQLSWVVNGSLAEQNEQRNVEADVD